MDYYEENPEKVDRADIIVGIPSYKEAETIAYPTTQAGEGLIKYFGGKRSVIINCDNDSPDGTKEAFLKTKTEIPKIYISTPPGVRGKGNNLLNLFQKADQLGADACILVDADLRTITPRWIKSLGEPLFMDFGLVTPLYVRHKYDGTITNNIAYPLIRSLYGRRVRQPIGGEFGFSGDMIRTFLQREFWNEEIAQFGIDIWMVTLAITHNIPVCQAFMGRPKVHRPKDPGAQLGPMFRQVVGTIFGMMKPYEVQWKHVKWSKPTAVFGFGLGEVEEPPPVSVDQDRLHRHFTEGAARFEEVWRTVMGAPVVGKVLEVRDMGREYFDFPSQLWARVLFDYAVAYRHSRIDRDTLLESLIPLYYGKVYSFVQRTERMSIQESEEYIEDRCLIFEEARSYLDERWDSSEGGAYA
jgi:glycosyltransferase involved in cell wall biosynthesis